MTTKTSIVVLLLLANIFGSSAFWSLDTDLQLGYEIYDKSYEINAIIQAIATAATRSNVIQSDRASQSAVSGLNVIASQLRNAPVAFFNELAYAASSRFNNEAWHLSRIRNNYANLDVALGVLLNETGVIKSLAAVSNPDVVSSIRDSLQVVRVESRAVLAAAEAISRNISSVRANSSLLLTPELLGNFIDSSVSEEIVSALTGIRKYFANLLLAVRDASRLVVAHGSVYELLTRSSARDTTSRNAALNSFVNNYNRVRSTLTSSVTSYRQQAETGIYNFIARVQATYQDDIVRPKFNQEQLPVIAAFSKAISSRVYNQTLFTTEFDEMSNKIVTAYSVATDSSLSRGSSYRDIILNLQREKFARRYPKCLDGLVAEAQKSSNSITSKYVFCLNERTNGILVVMPSTNSFINVAREHINFALGQLNACFGAQTVAGRTATSECIQFNVNNLGFYSTYLPIIVESNLRPIVKGPPLIFNDCIRYVPATYASTQFDELYSECSAENELQTTPTAPTTVEIPTEPPTVEPEEGSGFDVFN